MPTKRKAALAAATGTTLHYQHSREATAHRSARDHLGSAVGEPVAPGYKRRVAIKVIAERGNELPLVVEAI